MKESGKTRSFPCQGQHEREIPVPSVSIELQGARAKFPASGRRSRGGANKGNRGVKPAAVWPWRPPAEHAEAKGARDCDASRGQ